MSPRELARHPYVWLLAVSVLTHVLGVLLFPDLWLDLSGKEAAFEHAGHAFILASTLAWLWIVLRSQGPSRVVSILVCSYLAFCFLEEIDWGAVYRVDLGHTSIQRWTGGSKNLHNAKALEHGPLGWSLFWMTAPMVLYFLSGLTPRARSGRVGVVLPTRLESILFLVTVLASVVFDGLHLLHWRLGYVPRAAAGGSLGDALGWFQIAFYLLWMLVALRVGKELRARAKDSV